MQIDKWDITCDFADPNCFPPHYPSAPEKLKDKRYPMVNGPGYTYYNASHRGGSQEEDYTGGRCVPIFPSYDSNFNCTFYLISDTKTAYMKTLGAPKEFGDCCIHADKFYVLFRNFSENTNFTGVKDFGSN